jgi:hypothetical protein
MPPDNVIPFASREEQNHILFAAAVLPLARMIHSGRMDPETVTRKEFFDALIQLGTSGENAFEIHVRRVDEEMRLVAHCIEVSEAKSAIILLFTLVEGEVNTLIRMHLTIRGFPHGTISDALRGTDFDTKLDVLLPLLDVSVPDRLRNAALQCKAIRNMVVHNKATPSLAASTGDKPSDLEVATARANRFFAENPVDRLHRDIQDFFDRCMSENPAVQWSKHLFDKYHARDEA